MLPFASTLYFSVSRVLAQTPPGGGAAPLGDGAGGGGGGGGTGGAGTQGSPSSLLPMLLFGFLIFMVITMVMSGRREKKARAQLLSSLAKHDKVQTAGGMIGTIVEIKGEEVVLKVDESTNTKVRFSRNSVTTILKKGRGGSETLPEPETVDSAP